MPAENPRMSVLVVEDDPDYCQLLNEAFSEAGFRTLVASNGEKALQILRQEPVDLVVSDFIMPELNGLELCRLLGDDLRLSRLKVILYSCNTDSTFRRRARELGALDYLPKSYDTDSLVGQICSLAGITAGSQPSTAPREADTRLDERLRTVWQSTSQLKVLFTNLLDFTRILALSEEPSPAAKLAWEAAQRTGGDIQRLLEEIDRAAASEEPQVPTSEVVTG